MSCSFEAIGETSMKRSTFLAVALSTLVSVPRRLFGSSPEPQRGGPPPSGGPPVQVAVLSEISFVGGLNMGSGFQGELDRILWEPARYNPAVSEIYLEATVVPTGGNPATFSLFDVTNNLAIPGSSLTFLQYGRLRTPNLRTFFPNSNAEIALVVNITPSGSYSLRSAKVFFQQTP